MDKGSRPQVLHPTRLSTYLRGCVRLRDLDITDDIEVYISPISLVRTSSRLTTPFQQVVWVIRAGS